ncbi:hypothetical protein [Romboutsia sp.]|uniref:hypothetical protein n=1 Tax=Romboutsia sp. TaxID=1965302 RepID=UPI002C02AF06|nr:hypothetical protein [Romboutsia sp.]HSQ89455.1 hypothetical protein [Romboutsia sp.]
MKLIDLVLMGIGVYSFTFALCILVRISNELDRVNKQINYTGWIKVLLNTFLILYTYPLYIAYRKYIKKHYKGISILKLYYSIAVLTPELLDIAISSLVKNQKTIKQRVRTNIVISFKVKRPAINIFRILEPIFNTFNKSCFKNCY